MKITFLLALSLSVARMSLQVLLPKDSLLKSFSIIVDSEKLPVEFATKDGPVKERNRSSLVTGRHCGWFIRHVRATTEFFRVSSVEGGSEEERRKWRKLGSVSMKEGCANIDKTIMDGNFQAWKLIKHLISDDIIEENFYRDDILEKDSVESEKIVNSRVGHWVDRRGKQVLREKYASQIPVFSRFMSLASYIERTRDTYNGAVAQVIKEWKRDGSMGTLNEPDPFGKERRIKVYQVGNLVSILVVTKLGKVKNYVMSNVHLSRVLEYIKSIGTFAVFAPDIGGFDPRIGAILKLFRYQTKVGLHSPNGVGAVFKAARQFLFLRGDKGKSLGVSPEVLFEGGLTGVKKSHGCKAADFLEDLTGDRKTAMNLSNIFKMVPHPDADMKEVFDSIEGTKDSNRVELNKVDRFEGMARKAIYESLVQQRFEVRVVAKDPADEIAKSFADKINSTSTPVSSVLSAGYTKWSAVTFKVVRGIFDSEKQDIPTSNKSSAPESRFQGKDFESVENFKTVKELREVRERLKAVNDVVTVIQGTDKLSFAPARSRFRQVVREHEEFERLHLKDGVTIDDIDSEVLSDFVRSNPDASYTVLTEPKLGEVHKEVTRLFYMAEQALKIMTQVCERFTKKVISKSSGISIVKSYRSRRKEIESMLHAHTGGRATYDDIMGALVLFVSFDMSEFSKKFPQLLVRILGKIMGELSGEDWMSRIDIFFRASIVYHNTRGFLGVKSGVRGGFEGFLNFLWTLAMKVVMDIATQSTGVEGVLAVYSDDGLLRLYITGGKDKVKDKISTIKEVFKKYGLIFHLDKTVASLDIFEYLGLYSEDGQLLPTWVKEVTSIGKRKQDSGLETVYDKINLWESQSGAVVKAQGPPYPAMLVRTLLSMQTLRRLNSVASPKSLAPLTIIPYSAGGFRLSSISEQSIHSSIEPFSEFSADLELIYDDYPEASNAIAYRISGNLKSPKQAERTLPTGTLLQTDMVDTSGNNVARRLVESSSMDDKFMKDPITGKVREGILSELRLCSNFSPRAVRNLINEVPAVIEFNKALAIVRSSAALKFVKRSEIRKAQSKDTRKCKRSIERWVKEIETFEGGTRRVSSPGFTNLIIQKLYPNYSIARLKESPRVCLIPAENEAHILTTLEITEDRKLLYQMYAEPKEKFLGAQLSPEVSAESAFNTQQRRNERFVSVAARMVSTNTSLLNVYYIVANAFDLPCPSLPSTTVTSSHRSTRNFGMNAVSTRIPSPFHALVSSRMSNEMWGRIPREGRYDRTTLIEAARLACYMRLYPSLDQGSTMRRGVKVVKYQVRNLADNITNPLFSSASTPRHELLDGKTTKSFNSVIIEENAQANLLDSSVMTVGLMETVLDTASVKAILLTRMEKWVFSCINGNISTSALPTDVPDPWKRELLMECAISVSFRMCDAGTRRAVQLSFARFISLSDGYSAKDSFEVRNWMTILNREMMKRQDAFEKMDRVIKNVSGALSCLDLDVRLQEELMRMNIVDDNVLLHLISFMKRRSVTGGVATPTVVINSDSFADTKLSRDVKNAIKDTVDNLLTKYLDRATREREGMDRQDTLINFLSILKLMIRPSGHRNTPFNKHMVAIQMIKFELFIEKCLENGIWRIGLEDLKDFRLNGYACRSIIRNNAVIGGRSEVTSGEDMRSCLQNEGVLPGMISRARYILGKIRNEYQGNSITYENVCLNKKFMNELLNYILATYNSVVKNSVDGLEIRHSRESALVGSLLTATPVEDASRVAADIDGGVLSLLEVNLVEALRGRTYRDLLANLLIAHGARWGVDGYSSEPIINKILREHGMFGGPELTVRSMGASSLVSEETGDGFTLSLSSYDSKDCAIHNYLYVNRLAGGMAVVGKEDERYMLLSVIPRGVEVINTESLRVPEYTEEGSNSVPIYALQKVNANMLELSRVLNARPRLIVETGEIGAIVLQQAYQRIVGARTTVEDSDHFLVAMSEVVRGAWSMDLGGRLLGMMVSWMSTDGEVSRRDFEEGANRVTELRTSDDPRDSIPVMNSISAAWEWVRMMNIQAGPSIDTSLVSRIVKRVSMHAGRGGSPTAIYNMRPKSVSEVKAFKPIRNRDDVLFGASAVLFHVPVVREEPVLFIEEEGGDDW